MGQSDWGSTNPTGNMGATGNMGQSDWGSTNTTGNMGGQTQGWIHNQGSTGGADFTGGGQFQGSDRTAGDFGNTGTGNAAAHVSTGDKVRGTAEKLIGKATKNPELVERGQDRSVSQYKKKTLHFSIAYYSPVHQITSSELTA